MEGMIWMLLFALVLGFIAGYRYGTGRHPFGSASRNRLKTGEDTNEARMPARRAENAKPVDPVCHKAVWLERAKPSVHREVIYYFCSRECREIFEAAPDQYMALPG